LFDISPRTELDRKKEIENGNSWAALGGDGQLILMQTFSACMFVVQERRQKIFRVSWKMYKS
jgi:hypothetical protein